MTATQGHKRRIKRGKGGRPKAAKVSTATAPGEFLAPTPERLAKGAMIQTAAKVWQDPEATPLRRAHNRGKLTEAQRDAGERLEALCLAVWGSPGARSCLDWQIPGASETEPERAARLWQEYKSARAAMGRARAVVHRVAVLHEPIGKCEEGRPIYDALRLGLDRLAAHWGLDGLAA